MWEFWYSQKNEKSCMYLYLIDMFGYQSCANSFLSFISTHLCIFSPYSTCQNLSFNDSQSNRTIFPSMWRRTTSKQQSSNHSSTGSLTNDYSGDVDLDPPIQQEHWQADDSDGLQQPEQQQQTVEQTSKRNVCILGEQQYNTGD